jgi:hypothetical protein
MILPCAYAKKARKNVCIFPVKDEKPRIVVSTIRGLIHSIKLQGIDSPDMVNYSPVTFYHDRNHSRNPWS